MCLSGIDLHDIDHVKVEYFKSYRKIMSFLGLEGLFELQLLSNVTQFQNPDLRKIHYFMHYLLNGRD